MGLLHLLVLKAAFPSARVGLVELIEERRELALSLGADFACAPAEAKPAVDSITSGVGVDAVFDTAGVLGRPRLHMLDHALGYVRGDHPSAQMRHSPRKLAVAADDFQHELVGLHSRSRSWADPIRTRWKSFSSPILSSQ